jgi:S1-C subfamily serine protease
MAFRENLERMARIYEGVAIFSVEKGSTTHRAGVRAGDILMSVNGRRVRHHSEYGPARKLRSDEIELVVIRDGREVTLVASDLAAKAATPADSREPEKIARSIASVNWRGAA